MTQVTVVAPDVGQADGDLDPVKVVAQVLKVSEAGVMSGDRVLAAAVSQALHDAPDNLAVRLTAEMDDEDAPRREVLRFHKDMEALRQKFADDFRAKVAAANGWTGKKEGGVQFPPAQSRRLTQCLRAVLWNPSIAPDDWKDTTKVGRGVDGIARDAAAKAKQQGVAKGTGRKAKAMPKVQDGNVTFASLLAYLSSGHAAKAYNPSQWEQLRDACSKQYDAQKEAEKIRLHEKAKGGKAAA